MASARVAKITTIEMLRAKNSKSQSTILALMACASPLEHFIEFFIIRQMLFYQLYYPCFDNILLIQPPCRSRT